MQSSKPPINMGPNFMKLKFPKSKITREVKQVSNYPLTNFHLNFYEKIGRASIPLQKKAGN